MFNKRERTRKILADTPKNHGKLIDASAIFERLIYANAVLHMEKGVCLKKAIANVTMIKRN